MHVNCTQFKLAKNDVDSGQREGLVLVRMTKQILSLFSLYKCQRKKIKMGVMAL